MFLWKLLPNTNQCGTEGAEPVDTGKLLAMLQRGDVIEDGKGSPVQSDMGRPQCRNRQRS